MIAVWLRDKRERLCNNWHPSIEERQRAQCSAERRKPLTETCSAEVFCLSFVLRFIWFVPEKADGTYHTSIKLHTFPTRPTLHISYTTHAHIQSTTSMIKHSQQQHKRRRPARRYQPHGPTICAVTNPYAFTSTPILNYASAAVEFPHVIKPPTEPDSARLSGTALMRKLPK